MILYEREFTYGRSTVRFSVWNDDAGEAIGRMVMEPSEGRLHSLSMDVDPAILDGIANMVVDCANAFDAAVESRIKNEA